MPGLVAAAMLTFMTAWNDYILAVILNKTMASNTASVVTAGFETDVTTARTRWRSVGQWHWHRRCCWRFHRLIVHEAPPCQVLERSYDERA
jgi:hypothetical protein